MLNMDRGTRRLVAAGAIACALAAGAYATLRVTFGGRPVYIHVRWAPSVDDAVRQRLEQTLGLIEGEPREGRTWGYTLTAPSRANIQTLVQHPAVEDTHNLNRSTFRAWLSAPRRGYRTEGPVGLETLAVAALMAAVVSFGAAVLRMVTPQGSLAGPATIFSWVSPVIALLAATFIVLLASGSPWYGRLLDEDGMVENATALMLALAGVFFATAWRRMDARPARYFVGLLSVLLFAAAMEEISWGQRALQIESPQFFIENSDQREINVHNVLQQALAIRTKHVVGIAFLLYGVASPWLLRPGRLTRERLGRYVVVPPLFLTPAILISVLFMADVPTGNEEEIGEFLLSLCLCAFGAYQSSQARTAVSLQA